MITFVLFVISVVAGFISSELFYYLMRRQK